MHFVRALCLLALAGIMMPMTTAKSSEAADPVKIRIGWAVMPEEMIPAIYSNTGILKHYGKSYVVEPIGFQGSSVQVTALAAKEIDFALLPAAGLARGVTNAGLDVKVVADVMQDGKPGHYSQTFFVRADSGINSMDDIKGKNVAVNAIGSGADTILRAMLKKSGLDPQTSVNVIEVSFSNMLAMLQEGKVDVAPVDQPMARDLVNAGKLKALFSSKDALGPTQLIFMVGRTEFLEAHKEALQDFFEDHVRAMRWYLDPANREAALPIIAKAAERSVDDVRYFNTDVDFYRDPYLIPDIAGLQNTINAGASLGIMPGMVVAPDYADLSFVEEAKRRIEARP